MPVADTSRAVFLSYASQDAGAAERICQTLRAAGIEVWFDQSELRGGEAWDRQIHKQIHDCRLFIPVISGQTESRDEGYFRREWKLAVERTADLAADVPFLLPVVIDSTNETTARVPDEFLSVQWMRLPAGSATPTFVERVAHLMAAGVRERPGPMRAPQTSRRGDSRQRVIYVAVAAAVLLALGYFGLERLNRSKPSVPGGASIAVLPLANESGEASQQYFSDGISEDLITALSQFPGLKVIGRTSAFQFRDSKEDSRSIGSKLGVAHLLEGSVRRSGEMVRVSAELIDTADGSTQWSERYDRPYKDLFALQDEITRAVAGALRAKLLTGEHMGAQSERPPSGSLEAYNAVLQGRFYLSRRREADYRKAIESYTQAIALDPRYALAWSELSLAWTDLGTYFLEGAPTQEAHAKARAAVDRALALSPDLASAHIARGHLLQIVDLDWRGAEAELRRAMELAPNDGEAKFYFGQQLATFGQVEPAIELTRQGLATEPLRAEWYKWLAYYLSGLNRLDEAEPAIRRAIELQPASAVFHYALTTIEVQRGNAREALNVAQQEPPGAWQYVTLALARQIGDDRSEADAALKTLIDKDAGLDAYQIAQVYALRNDAKATFEWLDRALSNRDPDIGGLLYDPFILRYKDDPRFAAFCRKVGLPVPGETSARKAT